MAVNILIADDDAPIRRLLRRVIEEHDGWQVCGEAENGREVLARMSEALPDLVVMDLAMPQMNGLQAAREISKVTPDLPMLLLTVQQVSKELVREARAAGFHGAVSKSTGSEVVKGIETLLRHEDFSGHRATKFLRTAPDLASLSHNSDRIFSSFVAGRGMAPFWVETHAPIRLARSFISRRDVFFRYW